MLLNIGDTFSERLKEPIELLTTPASPITPESTEDRPESTGVTTPKLSTATTTTKDPDVVESKTKFKLERFTLSLIKEQSTMAELELRRLAVVVDVFLDGTQSVDVGLSSLTVVYMNGGAWTKM